MSPQIDHGLPNEKFPFPAYPNGWTRVVRSEELAPSGVLALRYFGRELVLFRTESGEARMLDAHCPHLGAHLGHGGKVEGEGIRCPFHAWHWSGDGSCLDVPYAERIPKAARTRAWQTCERNGFVFMWFHAEGKPPNETIPEIPEYASPEWTPYRVLRWKIRSRGYDMGENAVDDIHFRYLHGAASRPKTTRGDLRGQRSNLSKMKLDTPRGPVDGEIESTAVPGMGLVYVRGICDTLIVITSTPIDGDYVDQMFCYTQKRGQDPGLERLGQALLRDLEKQMNEDIVVFEHKKYFTKPLLVQGDGPIAEYRRSSRQRYSGEFFSLDDGRAPGSAGNGARTRRPGRREAFSERDFEELASFLRGIYGVRRVERREQEDRVTLELYGKGDVLQSVLCFERSCLDRSEVADLRAYLAQPLVKRRIRETGPEPFAVPSAEISSG